MKRRKNGFTLIELLVAIAIMISVTVIAVISITKVSEGSKGQSYELVKDQIETAALEYFSANEHLFEGMGAEKLQANISLGKLVDLGYINSVTNPKTGVKLNKCTKVVVTKSDKGYSMEYSDVILTDKECALSNIITVEEKGAPSIGAIKYSNETDYLNKDEALFYDSLGESEWHNASLLGEDGDLYIIAPIDSNNNGEISKVNIIIGADIISMDEIVINDTTYYSHKITENGQFEATIEATNIYNRTARTNKFKISKDSDSPEIDKFMIEENGSYKGSGNIKISADITEKGSSLDEDGVILENLGKVKSEYIFSYLGDSPNYGIEVKTNISSSLNETLTVSDIAGNSSIPKYASYGIYGECSNTKEVFLREDTCDCTKEGQPLYMYYNLVDVNTGKICRSNVVKSNGTCNPSGCKKDLSCNSDVSISYDASPNSKGWYQKDKVNITVTPSSNVKRWVWWTNTSDGSFKAWPIDGTENYNRTTTMTVSLSQQSFSRQGVVRIFDEDDNYKDCYTNLLKIDNTPPKCANLKISSSPSSPNGSNGWYKSKVSITLTPTNDIVSYGWFTNCVKNDTDCTAGYKHWTDNTDTQTKTLSEFTGLSERYGLMTIFDEAGNYNWCYTSNYKIDTTAPKVVIENDPPSIGTCNSGRSLISEYTVTDKTSGLASVKTYYGTDGTLNASSSYWGPERITSSGTKTFTNTQYWGVKCPCGIDRTCDSGTPSSGTYYYLKYKAVDVAGNQAMGMSANSKKY